MRLYPITHELCPRCHKGHIFRGPLWRTYLATNGRCPECNLKFEREQGYFLGAMYFSYMLSIPPVLVLILLVWWLTPWRFDVVKTEMKRENGYWLPLDTPGLGIEVDEAKAAKHPFEQEILQQTAFLEDGSVAEW